MSRTPVIALDASESGPIDVRQVRAAAFRSARGAYLQRVLREHQLAPGARALVVGGGKGIVPRDLAAAGLDVLAIDASPTATAIARRIAAEEGTPGEYRTGAPEKPDVQENAFDLAYYAETFEITTDLDSVVRRAAKALRPGGVLVYDTVNRTMLSRLVYLGLFQLIPFTRIAPPGRYRASRLRTPGELAAAFDRHGLRSLDPVGFKPRSVSSLVSAVLARRRQEMTDDDVGSTVEFILDEKGPPVVTYLGSAVKADS